MGGGKCDHWESENRNLHAIWARLMIEINLSRHLPALVIPSALHSTPAGGVLYLPLVYYTFRGCSVQSST